MPIAHTRPFDFTLVVMHLRTKVCECERETPDGHNHEEGGEREVEGERTLLYDVSSPY